MLENEVPKIKLREADDNFLETSPINLFCPNCGSDNLYTYGNKDPFNGEVKCLCFKCNFPIHVKLYKNVT